MKLKEGQIDMVAAPGGTAISMIVTDLPRDISKAIHDAKAGEWEVKLVKVRKKRSLDANGMYWKLLTDLASALRVAVPFLHNEMLRRYGQPQMYAGQVVYSRLPDTEEIEKEVDNDTTVHLRPTSDVREGKDGVPRRAYMLLRGSSTYNTQEFSVLLDGLIQECKDAGVETLTPQELRQLKEAMNA